MSKNNEFDGVFDADAEAAMMSEIDREASDPVETITTNVSPVESIPAWKLKLMEAKARAGNVTLNKEQENGKAYRELGQNKPVELEPVLAPGIETVYGDMGTPQTHLEAFVEADRRFAQNVINDKLKKTMEKALNADALYAESISEAERDNQTFKEIFIQTIQVSCAGKTLDEISDMLMRDHEMLYNVRVGIQAKLAYRAELMKDETAEKRAQMMEKDFLFRPAKRAKETKEKTAKAEAKPKESMMDKMRRTLEATVNSDGTKKFSPEQIEEKLLKFQGMI